MIGPRKSTGLEKFIDSSAQSHPAGRLVVFEGIDGTGKSTQVRLLAERLEAEGRSVTLSREPTDGPFGQKLRQSMVEGRLSRDEELRLFEDDRRHHVETLIKPTLARGGVVILDRYYFSTMAYQGARGFDPAEIRQRNESFAPVPDAVIILEIPVEAAMQRIGVRDGSGNTFEKKENLEACAAIFDALKDDFIHRIDASGTPAEVHAAVRQSLSALWP
ncbi:MAG: dTMP kinase [Verrucomicrobiota bacterium JB023]|nr:dTMP kinase [Verrucomicrobiota bacterium JB023]